MSHQEHPNNDCTCNKKLASLEKRVKALEKVLYEMQIAVAKEIETIKKVLKR